MRELEVEEKAKVKVDVSRLEKLGLKAAAGKLDRAAKMKVAYECYLFVSMEKINKFQEKLKADSREKDESGYYQYKRLRFENLETYPELPPEHVLEALEEAQQKNCFDFFEVAKIEWFKEIPDPILFGRIRGCEDRFFISQWDDDVKFEDIIFMD